LPEAAYRPVIQATLEELAGWIEECVGVSRAAVAGQRYRVVLRRA